MKNFFTKKNIIIIAIVVVVLSVVATVGFLFLNKETKATCTIAFNSNGGTAVNSITGTEGETVKLPENPTKEGFNFLYWADNEGKPVSEELLLEKDVALVAIWAEKDKETCTVTFNTDGGTAISPILVVKGEKLTFPNNPTKEGYEFKEWKDSKNNVMKNNFSVEEDITLTAVWTKVEKQETKKNEPKQEPKNVDATEISLNTSDFSMVVNTSKTLKATIKPDNTTNKNVEWSSSDSSIITVDKNGVVKAVGLGTAIVKAKTSNGKQAMVSITSEIESISLSSDTKAVSYYGTKTANITATIDANGYNVPDSAIVWSIPDTSGQNAPASSSVNGKKATVTARSSGIPGSVTVTVKVGKKQATLTIAVEPQLTLSKASGNTTNFFQTGNTHYTCTFTGEQILSISASTDVTWSFNSNSSIIAGISTNSNRNLRLSIQPATNSLNVTARTAGGQMRDVTVSSN